MNELKYCKFCDKEKPIKDFCKSGFAIKNICKECQNKKQTQIYKNSKEVDKLKQENKQLKSQWNKLKEYLHNVDVVIDHSENYDGRFINYNELVNKMQEIEGSDNQ
jgi:hypothetical protein